MSGFDIATWCLEVELKVSGVVVFFRKSAPSHHIDQYTYTTEYNTIQTMEYYIAKGKRRREERAAASTAETYRPSSFQLTDTKSLETSTTSNTLITTTSYDDDSDEELGAFVYKTSQTAQRLREEQQQASVTSTQTTTRRKSSRLKNIKSKEDKEKEKSLSIVTYGSTPTTDNKKNTKKVSRSRKRKVAVSSGTDEVDDSMAPVLREEFRNGRRLCSSNGCFSLARRGGVCTKHGAKVASRKICSHEGCNKYAQKGGVCIRHGAKVKTWD